MTFTLRTRLNTRRHKLRTALSRRGKRLLLLAILFGAATSGPSATGQLPDGGTFAAGAGTLDASVAGTLNVNTTTGRAVIDWNNFSIDAGNTVNFNQPGIDSAVLNRVGVDGASSLIHGALNSNGNVFLVNPHGIVIGGTGVINTNGFTASTMDIGNDAFMNGEDLNFTGSSVAGIINEGSITTAAGGANLIAREISNTGNIISNGGSINMATGGMVSLANGNSYVQASIETITSGISSTAPLIQSTGTIRATGALTVGGDIYLVNPSGNIVNEGDITAQITDSSSNLVGGSIELDASGGQAHIKSGTLDASGETGGTITLSGKSIRTGTSNVDASGTGDGGTIAVTANEQNVMLSGSFDASGNQGGSVTFRGPDVSLNNVNINASGVADGGTITVAATEPADSNSESDATQAISVDGTFNVSGTQGGTVTLTGRAVYADYDVDASGTTQGGTIDINGSESAYVDGSLDVSGGQGGLVMVAGDVVVLSALTVDASGDNGGGEVLIGGGKDGQDSRITNALYTSVSSASTIDVRSKTSGDAGTAVVYSVGETGFAGSIDASAQGATGDGGYAEVVGLFPENTGTINVGSVGGSLGTKVTDLKHAIINERNVSTVAQRWYNQDLVLKATESIQILVDLIPTLQPNDQAGKISPNSLTFEHATDATGPIDVTIDAKVRDQRTKSSSSNISTINANGGTFTITENGSLDLRGITTVTAAEIDLQGSLMSSKELVFNAYDAATHTATANVALGDDATGAFQLSDTTLGHVDSEVTINGADFDVDFGGETLLSSSLNIRGDDVNLDQYNGQGLDIEGDLLTVTGPVAGWGTFRYAGPSTQSVGLGSATGQDVTLDENILAGITGFSTFEIGNPDSIASVLQAIDADLSEFRNVVLNGATMLLQNLSINENLRLEVETLTIPDLITKVVETGTLNISTLDSGSSIGLGDNTAGDLLVDRQSLTNLGKYENLWVTTGGGDLHVNLDLKTNDEFSGFVTLFNYGSMFVDQLSTNANEVSLFAHDLIVGIDLDSDSSTKTINNAAKGTLQLNSTAGANTTMKIGAGAAGDWTLDTDEISEISGFADLELESFSTDSTIAVEDADLSQITEADGTTTFTADHFTLSGTEGVTIDGQLTLNIDKTIDIDGPINTLSTKPLTAFFNVDTSLGLGDDATGEFHLTQRELGFYDSFAELDFTADATDIDAEFNKDITINSGNHTTNIDALTHTVSGKKTTIQANALTATGTLTSDGEINITTSGDLAASNALIIDRSNLSSNPEGQVSNITLDSTSGDINVELTGAAQGLVSANASTGSVTFESDSTLRLGELLLPDTNYDSDHASDFETLSITTTSGDVVFTEAVDALSDLVVVSAGRIQTSGNGLLNENISGVRDSGRIYLTADGSIEHVGQGDVTSGLRVGSSNVIEVAVTGTESDVWLDARHGDAERTTFLGDFSSEGDVAVDAYELGMFSAISLQGDSNVALRTIGSLFFERDVQIDGSGNLTLIAGWDGTTAQTTPHDVTELLDAETGPGSYGNAGGKIQIGGRRQRAAVGSRNGKTLALAENLQIDDSARGSSLPGQLGFYLDNAGSATGDIEVRVTDSVDLQGSPSQVSYALIGHGDRWGSDDTGKTVSGDIRVVANDSISLRNARIGHQLDDTGTYQSGDTLVASGFDRDNPGTQQISLESYSQLGSGDAGELKVYIPRRGKLSVTGFSKLNGSPTTDFNNGTYANEVFALPFEGDYEGTAEQNWTIFIGVIEIAVKALSGEAFYGDTHVDPGLQLTSGELDGTDTLESIGLSTSFDLLSTSDAGDYDLTIDSSKLSELYELTTSIDGEYTINKAPITVTATDGTSVYGAEPVDPGLKVTAGGLKLSDTLDSIGVTSSFDVVATDDAGDYAIQVLADDLSTNYELTKKIDGTFTIEKAPIAVTAVDGTSVYGDVAVDPGLKLSEGFLRFDHTLESIGLSTDFHIVKTDDAGTYKIAIVDDQLSANYKLTEQLGGKFVVEPAPLSINVPDALKPFLNRIDLQKLDWEAIGLKNDDAIDSIALRSGGTEYKAALGGYAIEASDPAGVDFKLSNYDITYNDGTMYVVRTLDEYIHQLWNGGTTYAQALMALGGDHDAVIGLDGSGTVDVDAGLGELDAASL